MRADERFAAGRLSRSIFAAAVFVLVGMGSGLEPVHSQTAGGATGNGADKVRDLRGEWLRAGPGFVCKVPGDGKLPPEAIRPDILMKPCLHMGPFVVGDDAQTATKVLGTPHRTISQPNEAVASIYFLESMDRFPYLVVTVSKKRIVALQVTGPAAAKGYGFNHVELGMTTAELLQYFGQPYHLEPSSEKDTDLWTYNPWPFSFEVKGGRVTSIRIAER